MAQTKLSDILDEIELESTTELKKDHKLYYNFTGIITLVAAISVTILILLLSTNLIEINPNISLENTNSNLSFSFVIYSVLFTSAATLFYGFIIYYKFLKEK